MLNCHVVASEAPRVCARQRPHPEPCIIQSCPLLVRAEGPRLAPCSSGSNQSSQTASLQRLPMILRCVTVTDLTPEAGLMEGTVGTGAGSNSTSCGKAGGSHPSSGFQPPPQAFPEGLRFFFTGANITWGTTSDNRFSPFLALGLYCCLFPPGSSLSLFVSHTLS